MPSYTKENSDLPTSAVIVPSFDANQAITAVTATFDWASRIKNDADASDIIIRQAASKSVDLWRTDRSVTAGGVTRTYRQVAMLIKAIADAER